eukprot:gene204-biopygen152
MCLGGNIAPRRRQRGSRRLSRQCRDVDARLDTPEQVRANGQIAFAREPVGGLAHHGIDAEDLLDHHDGRRAGYDMTPDQFAALTDKLWKQVEPLYLALHTYVRWKLNEKYGDKVQSKTGPIRADLLGNMWAQEWGNIYDLVAPPGATASWSRRTARRRKPA